MTPRTYIRDTTLSWIPSSCTFQKEGLAFKELLSAQIIPLFMIVKGFIFLLLCLCWGRMALNDYSFRAVRPLDVLLVTGILVIFKQPSMMLLLSLLFLNAVVLFFQIARSKQWLSLADACILSASCLWIRPSLIPIFFMSLGGSLLIYHMITKEERAPFLTLHLFVFVGVLGYQDFSIEKIIRNILP